jgi:hypothetical protein
VVAIAVVRPALAFLLVSTVLLSSGPALADVSSWLAVGGGAAIQRNRPSATRDVAAAFTYSVGVGSSPLAPLVLGAIARGTTMFGLGTDLGVALRAATGGFARGDWGVALEAGALWRPWRDGTYGEWPVQGVVTGGSPWGLALAAGAELWSVDGGTAAQGFFAVLEIDLLRLTLMRQGGTERWWPNPNPGGGRKLAFPSAFPSAASDSAPRR